METPLVSIEWLQQHLNDTDLVILDASIPKVGQKEQHLLADTRIPGARFFDLKKEFSDLDSDLPNTFPSPEAFSTACRRLGINQNSKIVVYDHHGIYSSPRAWWLFRAMGHNEVAVLNGGLPAWIEKGLPTLALEEADYVIGNFEAQVQPRMICDATFVRKNIDSQEANVLDARSVGRFYATAPEPRKELKRGHIPQSQSLPYTEVLQNGKMRPRSELKELLTPLQLVDKPRVFSCGSGITACVILLACEWVLSNPKILYDGSWTDWAQPNVDNPVAP